MKNHELNEAANERLLFVGIAACIVIVGSLLFVFFMKIRPQQIREVCGVGGDEAGYEACLKAKHPLYYRNTGL